VASDGQQNFEFLIVLSIIWKTNKSAASTTGGNFDEFEIRRAASETCSRNSEFGNHLSVCLKTEENQENLCRDRRTLARLNGTQEFSPYLKENTTLHAYNYQFINAV
jgi:hypothetical protein